MIYFLRHKLVTILAFCFLLLGQGVTLASTSESSVITATVEITPFVVSVYAPSPVPLKSSFKVEAEIGNLGDIGIKDVVARIELPPGLRLVRGEMEQKIRKLRPEEEKTVRWFVKADFVGTYTILVSVSGRDEINNALVRAQGETTVQVFAGSNKKERWGTNPFKYLWGLTPNRLSGGYLFLEALGADTHLL